MRPRALDNALSSEDNALSSQDNAVSDNALSSEDNALSSQDNGAVSDYALSSEDNALSSQDNALSWLRRSHVESARPPRKGFISAAQPSLSTFPYQELCGGADF